ncbi:MAG: hypothetical protein EKK64_06595 [Neisseriaceae bacterium]|nr:MAG: hypothetical protein EKK64_06595 [Neisseriaceae bacterium]
MKHIPKIKTLNESRQEWGLSLKDSSFIIEQGLTEIYSKAIINQNSQEIANWYINEPIFRKLPIDYIEKIIKFPKSIAKKILEKWSEENFELNSYEKIISEYTQSKDLDSIIKKVIKENQKIKQDYLNGKTEAASALIGKVLKESKGEDPQNVKTLILKCLKDSV